jgi:hypothetical protein
VALLIELFEPVLVKLEVVDVGSLSVMDILAESVPFADADTDDELVRLRPPVDLPAVPVATERTEVDAEAKSFLGAAIVAALALDARR